MAKEKMQIEVLMTQSPEIEVGYLDLNAKYEGQRNSQEVVGKPLVLDFSDEGRLIGIEFLNADVLPQITVGGV
tara:strand:- start:8773 stop:8991 length:219 start_codon:yes stop_codon:yes gene_type:complete